MAEEPRNEIALTPEQVDTYQRNGVILLKSVISDETRAAIAARFAEIVDDFARALRDSGDLASLYEDLPFDRRWAAIRAAVPAKSPVVWRRVLVHPAVYRLWFEPALLGAARTVLGPELRAYDLFNGRPREPHAPLQTIHWHQDAFNSAEWDQADSRILTFWVPLVPVDQESGCLAVVPGSQRLGALTKQTDEFGISTVEAVPEDGLNGVPVPMEPGDALMFNELVLHRSLPNRSDRVRWSIDVRFSTNEPAHQRKAPGGFRVRSDQLGPEPFAEWAAKWDPKTGVMRRQLRRLDLYASSLGPAGRDVRTY